MATKEHKEHKKLTPKQLAFVLEYLKDFNGQQAAIRAGYAPRAARMQASRLLTNANVQSAIHDAQLSARSEAIMSYEEMCERLSSIARRKLTDFLDERGQIDVRRGDAQAIASVDRLEVGETGMMVKLRLVDPLRAMEQLAKLKGYNAPTKIAPTDPSGDNPYLQGSVDELLALALRIAAGYDAATSTN
jgi:phage terminase small subunit